MKKFIFGLSAIAIIITGIFTFAGCEKEESTDIRPVAIASAVGECPTCSETNISLDSLVYVQNRYFIDNYGIDIHEFSSNANFQQLITEINEMTSDISDFMANADSAQLEASRLFLEQKTEELQMYEEADNTTGMLSVAEEIFATVMPSKPMNDFLYKDNSYLLPVDYMEMKTEAISNAIHQLEDLYPSLRDMSCTDYQTLLQISFIASEIDENNGLCFDKGPTNESNSNTQTRENLLAYEKCIEKAKADYAINATVTTTVMTGGLISIGMGGAEINLIPLAGTAAYVGCIVGVFAKFAWDSYQDNKAYKKAIELCELKYKK